MSAASADSKRKWEDSDSDVEVVEYSIYHLQYAVHSLVVGFMQNNPRVLKILWVSYDTMAQMGQYVPVLETGAV